jgi:hypothetical protein
LVTSGVFFSTGLPALVWSVLFWSGLKTTAAHCSLQTAHSLTACAICLLYREMSSQQEAPSTKMYSDDREGGGGSGRGSVSSGRSVGDIDAKVPVADRLKRYVTKTRTYSYFGPFPVQEVAIKAVRRDEEGVGLYDIDVQCRGGFSWTITLRYAQLYESFKWQVKYDKDLRLPLTHQFPPKDRFSYKPLDDDALEARREGLEKWLNGRIDLVHSYESEPELMKNVRKEMSYILKVGEYGPSLRENGRTSSVASTDVRVERLFTVCSQDDLTIRPHFASEHDDDGNEDDDSDDNKILMTKDGSDSMTGRGGGLSPKSLFLKTVTFVNIFSYTNKPIIECLTL